MDSSVALSVVPPADVYFNPSEYTFHRWNAIRWQLDPKAFTLNDIFKSTELVPGDTFTLSSTIIGDEGSISDWCGKSHISGYLASTASDPTTGKRIGAPCVIIPHVQARLTQVSIDISQGEHIVDFVNSRHLRDMYPLRFSRNETTILRTINSLLNQQFASEPQQFENIGVTLSEGAESGESEDGDEGEEGEEGQEGNEGATRDASGLPGTVTLSISAVCLPANNGSEWEFNYLEEPVGLPNLGALPF